MDIKKFEYQNLIRNQITKAIKTKTFTSLDEMLSTVSGEVYDAVNIIADLQGWPVIDEATFNSYFETVRKEVQANYVTTINPASELVKNKKSWLTSVIEKRIEWNYTDRYLKYLLDTGRPETVVNEVAESSYKILARLSNPRSDKPFFIKGLVDGDVQSGKTGNFNAVINRSIDSGFKLIIVLSGIMDDLRTQTQSRIDKDVVGEGKGVGEVQGFNHDFSGVEQIRSITSEKADFSRPLKESDFTLSGTNILVCKKNVSILKNILIWLHDSLPSGVDKHSIPLLIIDDEADNASLNNEGHKGQEYASQVNKHIRAILGLFHKKAYLGYTATPFANVIQDRNSAPNKKWELTYKQDGQSLEKNFELVNNLFPDDFIFLLDSPTNYIGANKIFQSLGEDESLPIVFPIDDHTEEFPSRVIDDGGEVVGVERFDSKNEWDDRVGKYGLYLSFLSWQEYRKGTRASKSTDSFPNEIPESLENSIISFIISIAVRETRQSKLIHSKLYQPHNTMLIHISRFTSWQNKTEGLVKGYCLELQTRLRMEKPSSPGSIYERIEKVWRSMYAETTGNLHNYLPENYVDEFMQPVSFEAILPRLCDASDKIDVLALNSKTGEKVDYTGSPRKVIAIGGNRLSRGFTLEGLTISYFVRTTNYSDSLLQMGRWFGYRPGYLDCCKLFTTDDLVDKYNSTNICIEELKSEFKKMDDNHDTPRDFELRVKKHPGVLKITRDSMLKNTVSERWSFQDSLVMTRVFDISKNKISNVWRDFKQVISPMLAQSNSSSDPSMVSAKVSANEILEILSAENNFEKNECYRLKQYIERCAEKGLLTNWTLAIKITGNATEVSGVGKLPCSNTGLNVDLNLAIRKGPVAENGNMFYREFINAQKFKPTGKSANIMSSGADFKVALDQDTAKKCEELFVDNKYKELKGKYPDLDDKELMKRSLKTTKPEGIYREAFTDREGVLVIYLFDPHYVFNQPKDNYDGQDKLIKKMLIDGGQELGDPLVGLAVGFPKIDHKIDPYGEYVKGDYELETLIDEEEDMRNVPDDVEL